MAFAFYCINFLCWTAGKYLLKVNVKLNVENQETVVGMSENESYQWKELQDNESISLSSATSRDMKIIPLFCNDACC